MDKKPTHPKKLQAKCSPKALKGPDKEDDSYYRNKDSAEWLWHRYIGDDDPQY